MKRHAVPADLVIIGAGPYGLSIAAHLRARGVSFRIFGQAMDSWRNHMPLGMFLKSEGFASNLYDPESRSTLKDFCTDEGLPYGEIGVRIPRGTITAYGLAFQQRHVPDLDLRTVDLVERSANGFQLRLVDGETLTTRRVIVAVGSGYFRYVPGSIGHLPPELLSHSWEHHDLRQFQGRDVTVIGGGSSAVDIAALLKGLGVDVRVVARRGSLVFLSKNRPRTMWSKVRYPLSGIGPGWRNRFLADAPMVFRHLPQDIRLRTVRTHLGPASVLEMRDRILGRVPVLSGRRLKTAETSNGRVKLTVVDDAGTPLEITTDHLIAATGYQVDVRRVTFLDSEIHSSLRLVEGAPVLSRNFESSIPGLYFVGLSSALEYGPVMRFMFGARYTARRLSWHLGHQFRSGHARAAQQLRTRATSTSTEPQTSS
jgi:pyridine nucleotide-disulfide oxidoreductase